MPRSDGPHEARYLHDVVSADELLDLLGAGSASVTTDVPSDESPERAADQPPPAVLPKIFDLFGREMLDQVETPKPEQVSLPLDTPPSDFAESLPAGAESDEIDASDRLSFDEDDADLSDFVRGFDEATVEEALDPTFDVPDISQDEPETAEELLLEVPGELRARQQAIAFLISIGELSGRHVDWIVEIILARRWSTTQLKVRGLWNSGYSLRSIFQAFVLAELWRESDAFDERPDEYRRGPAWMSVCTPRLSWWESMQIIAFRGEDSSLEEVVEFIEIERHAWRSHSGLRHRFVRFKDYLLRQRISDECQSPAGGWYRTLDPRDERDFDGAGNPEYTTRWWEDEIPAIGGPQHLERRIYLGDRLGALIVEPDDGLHWLED